MDWQSLIAIGLAVAGGAWAAWSAVRPFVRRHARCGDCGGHPAPPDLLQIDPPKGAEGLRDPAPPAPGR
ncbi:MAG: hypothetical protein HYW07_24565 [Candidatus Latescibacteria bacterium]|nr:hypothetical protein [Candidatus Latescibacterota bacterium]